MTDRSVDWEAQARGVGAHLKRVAAAARESNDRANRYQAAYLRCRRQYQVLNKLHQESQRRVAGLLAAQPGFPGADDDMCPNCVTPWKCNGPHHAQKNSPQSGEEHSAP